MRTLLLSLFFLIWFQQVPVLRSGGSLKLYELAGMLVLAGWFFVDARKRIHGASSMVFFVFFILLPAISLVLHFESLSFSFQYFAKFPQTLGMLRYDVFMAPILVFVYYAFCWAVWNALSGSESHGLDSRLAVRLFLAGGVVTGLYSIYGLIGIRHFGFPDFIPSLIDARNSRPISQDRPSGFSAEPGIFIVTLTWAVLFSFFLKNSIRDSLPRWGLFLFFSSLLALTRSSALLGPVLAVIAWILLYGGRRARIGLVMALALGVAFYAYLGVSSPVRAKELSYIFYTKLINFTSGPVNTLDSGGMRRYTSLLGLEVFNMFPWLGGGPGTSLFHLHLFEHSFKVMGWGERLGATTPIQNCHSMILAECGILGYLAFSAGWLAYFFQIHRLRKLSPDWHAVGFIGGLATWFMLFSVIPTHGLYIWLCPALCVGVARQVHRASTAG